MHHTIRYAFGLSPDLGTSHRAEAYLRAFVAGAETFFTRNLPALPSSKEEVESLRNFLHDRGLTVAPPAGLPPVGRSLFAEQGAFDLIHLSTHSQLDEKVPMVDALVFPRDELFAYDLALSPVRAKLLVLSACKLFSLRHNRVNPVSGITTAALARLAPQVISTLWAVNDTATKIFMLRFYDALMHVKEPAAALAAAKRDFLNPSRLESWMKSAEITVPSPADFQSYKDPYFWAPFVLIVGG
jgi:CHAT domain-containing protein